MIETAIERLVLASRWLQVPLYLGLALALVVVVVRFFVEIVHLVPYGWQADGAGFVPAVLALVGIVLIANLVIVAVISGYENCVSRIDAEEAAERLAWFGKLDSGSIKIKLAISIVAISSIHLLKSFIDAAEMANDKPIILMVMHLVFVLSALILVWIDRLVVGTKATKSTSQAAADR